MEKITLHLGFYGVFALALTLWGGDSLRISHQVIAQPGEEIPFFEKWASSAHANAAAEAFTHWDEDDSKQMPAGCVRCHSSSGYRDFIGADGSAVDTIENSVPGGSVIDCVACHNESALTMDSVVMPSGIEISGLGRESECMQCHQGRASKFSVDTAIQKTDLTDVDTVSPELSFINTHYYAAASTKYGTAAKGGYEYAGKSYDAYFVHVEQFDSCIECHDPHTLQIPVEQCRACHPAVKSVEDLKNVRMQGSLADYDGDGNIREGIYYEIEGLQRILYQALRNYAAEKAKTGMAYDAFISPYFFIDTNNNGIADASETNRKNKYDAWTPRLLKAAYNYQISMKDPGSFVHGGKYVIELLYDSIEDLNAALTKTVDLKNAHRIDAGHFAGSEEPFRQWDKDGKIPGACSKCHSATGLPLYLEEGDTISQSPANGFQCATCHDDLTTFTRYEVINVKFPSGAVIDSKYADTNLCMTCHQGRQATTLVNKFIKGLDDDKVYSILRFQNIHYLAAGATRFGTEAKGAYEYDGKKYVGLFEHTKDFSSCTDCHNTHELNVEVEKCEECHSEVKAEEGFMALRMSTRDYDGDGDTKEGIAGEIETLRKALHAAIEDYGKQVTKTDIMYASRHYPYYFIDTDANGKADPDEVTYSNRYNAWTPNLLRAVYNYQYSLKDPGGFAHNSKYIIQILYDSLESLGTKVKVNMTGMTRP